MKWKNKARRRKEIIMLALHPAGHRPQDAEQPEDQIPLNNSESNGYSPTFFSAPCSPSHSLSSGELGTEAVKIDGVVESSQNPNKVGLHLGTGEESTSVACDRDSAPSGSAPNLKDLVVEFTSNSEEEIAAEKSVVHNQHITAVAEERKQVVEISEEPLEQEDSSDDRAKLLPLLEDGDNFEARRLSREAETLPAQVEPSAPQKLQRTKWWNCCGLLEAFHRS